MKVNNIKFDWFISKSCYHYFENNSSQKLIINSNFNIFDDEESVSLKSVYEDDFEKNI